MGKKPKLLWISYMAPYDKVRHASGKTQNFFLKGLNSKKSFDIKLLTFATEDERNNMDVDIYNIPNIVNYFSWSGFQGFMIKVTRKLSEFNIYGEFAGLTPPFHVNKVIKGLKQLKHENFIPDIIILQWSEMAFLHCRVKKYFPNTKIVAIEEDVTFLGHLRKAMASKGLKRMFLIKRYQQIKKRELAALNAAELIILNNYKDKDLLIGVNNEEKKWVWCPYYQSMLPYPRNKNNKDILFYGAMFREENWKSAVWFIENVFNLIIDPESRFIVIGDKPPKVLQKYNSDRIKVIGFVDNILAYFQQSLCLVAPLVLGAGVKIKVIEGMSSGIPVLTNHIGIEGIPATNGTNFFYCEKPEEFAKIINALLSNEIDIESIEYECKDFIANKFNYEKDINELEKRLKQLI